MAKLNQPSANAKWVKGVSPKQTLHEAAHRILTSRLSTVWYWLPLAAGKSDEDVEYVHQLRVATRRAVEAVRVFSELIPESASEDLRTKLREVRRLADKARNLDVLCAGYVHGADASCKDTCRQIAEAIRRRRQDAQQPIVTLHGELAAAKFPEQINEILAQVGSAGQGRRKPAFGRQARRYLKPALKGFFEAAGADFTDDEALHRFRIRTKKLRYTMEIVAVAFPPCFRKKLYRQISALQELLGLVNDHAAARTLFGEWISQTDDARQEAFFLGALLAETKAHADIRQAFVATWTPQAVSNLRQQFAACRRPYGRKTRKETVAP